MTKAFHHNVKVLLKYCEVMMSPEKFAHIFGFESVKLMNPKQKSSYYSPIKNVLQGVAKFQGHVMNHCLSDTIPANTESGHNGFKTKLLYQVYLFQDLKSSVTYYQSDIK